MTQYTQNYSLPYPEGQDAVAVHADIENLAKRVDVTIKDGDDSLRDDISAIGDSFDESRFYRRWLTEDDRLDSLQSGTYWANTITTAEAVGLPSDTRGSLVITRSGANGNAIFISNGGNHPLRVYAAERVSGEWTWALVGDDEYEGSKFYRGWLTDADRLDDLETGNYWANTISIAEAVGLPGGMRGTLTLTRSGANGSAIFISNGGDHPIRVYVAERLSGEWTWEMIGGGNAEITELHAFLVAGQSNMAGHGTPYGDEMDPTDPRILQYGSRRRVIEPATVPLDMHRETVGLSTATVFAREYLKNQPAHVGVLLIAAARGASYLKPRPAGDYVWYPGGAAAPEYDLYGQAITQTQEALAADSRAELKGILWHQGEGNNGDTEAEYIGYQDFMISKFREDLSRPDLPFMLGGLVPEGTDNFPGRKPVDVAISKTPARLERVGYSPAEYGWAKFEDETHFSRSGVEHLGHRYYHAYHVALSNSASSRPLPPVDVTARSVHDGVIVSWKAPLCRVTEYRVEQRTDGGSWQQVTRDNPMYPRQKISGNPAEVRVTSIHDTHESTPVVLEV